MGHRQQMTDAQRLKFDLENYQRRLDANKGSNYEYWTENHYDLLEKGWVLYEFNKKLDFATSSKDFAKSAVRELRLAGNFARIVCGYEKNRQRIKMYSVIYKSKNDKKATRPNT